MIFVVVEELIPGSRCNYANVDLVTMATIAGFALMMVLALRWVDGDWKSVTR
jgi:ZIP family zinc transporter